MIRNNELRIGNYVRFEEGIGRIISISSKEYRDWDSGDEWNIGVAKGSCGIYYLCTEEELEPIPLTDELLLKFGFEYLSENEKVGFLYPEIPDGFRYRFTNIDNIFYVALNMFNRIPMNYLHELQNFHFSIFKQELDIKLL